MNEPTLQEVKPILDNLRKLMASSSRPVVDFCCRNKKEADLLQLLLTPEECKRVNLLWIVLPDGAD